MNQSIKLILILYITVIQVFILNLTHESKAARSKRKSIRSSVVLPKPILEEKNLWARLHFISKVKGGKFLGLSGSAGYQWDFLSLDLRLSLATLSYGAISVSPGGTDIDSDDPSNQDPDSEVNRYRDDSEPWSWFLVEPGISFSGRLFPDWAPNLIKRGRIGIGVGNLTDQQNDLGFGARVVSIEAGIQYLIGKRNFLGGNHPLALELAGTWYAGVLLADNEKAKQLRRLPVSLFTLSFGIMTWF